MIDASIVAIYLVGMILVGYWSGRGVHTMKDYAVSHRRYDTFLVVATISATLIGGGTVIGTAERAFSVGLVYLAVVCGAAINQLLIGQFIAPRIGKYDGLLSVGDMMGKHYGKAGKLLGGLATVLISVGFTATQVAAMGYVFNYFLGIPHLWGVLIGCGIVIFYSTLGGMKSVIATDFFQFAILIIAIPLVCNVGVNEVGGFAELFRQLPAEKLSLLPQPGQWMENISMFITFLLMGAFFPSIIQRLLVARDVKQAIYSARINAALYVPFFAIVAITGLIAFLLAPNIAPDLALPYLVDTLLPIGLRGLVVAGLLAVLMSSADSELNVAAVAVVHDIIKPLRSSKLRDSEEMVLAKWATFILGVSTIIIAISFKSVVSIMLYSFTFWGPLVMVPLVMGIFGYQVTKKYFIASVLAGALTVIIWNICLQDSLGFDGKVPGMLANLCIFGLYRLRNPKKLLGSNEA